MLVIKIHTSLLLGIALTVASYRDAGSPADQSAHAAVALFRLAEILDQEGADEEATKLYRDFLDQFPKYQPQAGIARKKLGLDNSLPGQPKLIELGEDKEDPELAEDVLRNRWCFTRELKSDELLMTTFEV